MWRALEGKDSIFQKIISSLTMKNSREIMYSVWECCIQSEWLIFYSSLTCFFWEKRKNDLVLFWVIWLLDILFGNHSWCGVSFELDWKHLRVQGTKRFCQHNVWFFGKLILRHFLMSLALLSWYCYLIESEKSFSHFPTEVGTINC